ncbi:unnamed protein product [Oncorhynchus mykiss]|uniref:Rho-GAP domain-containing protein n=1 Tax=Oncorhynchus mykiss TaxID=8022 RepID=A0A060WI16_ONCMY|nr:unnamed protein product [Oncorhynchus mykiss]
MYFSKTNSTHLSLPISLFLALSISRSFSLHLSLSISLSFFLSLHFSLFISLLLFFVLSLSRSGGPGGEKDRAALSHEAFLLMANSQSDMDDWVKAIRRVIWAPFGGAKTLQEWVLGKSLNVLEWPSQSRNLNPIKHLWRDLKIAVQRCSPSNLTELERICSSRVHEPDWIELLRPSLLGKCGFGMYEKHALILCSTCSMTYYDYSDLSVSSGCDCVERRRIFGQHLEDTVQYEKKFGHRLAPLLVEQCVDFIKERGLDEEGLFRMPGQANLVKDLQEAFDCGDKPLFDSNTDVHTVASLLKLYLRELPEPVVPFSKYEDFLSCAQLLAKDVEEVRDTSLHYQRTELLCHSIEASGVQELVKQVSNLPPANYNLLKYICMFLDEVQSHANKNKMSVQNLATVFGPNILRPKMEDPVAIMEGTSLVQSLMTVLISEHNRLYSGRGELEEDLQNCPTNPNEDLACSSASSLDAKLCAATTPPPRLAPSGKGEPVVSPSKQTKNLPSWKYSFKGTSTPRPPPQADVTTVSPSGNWLMNGLSSLRSHRRTSSGERVRDSTGFSQRLSTYDNVTSSSSMGKQEQDSSEAMELCSKALTSLVEGLKDELRKQKVAYETRIKRLEESSAALCAQMERLEQEMEQERKKQRMLEIKLRNSERARHDAENRNRLLEKEMEDFFSTLGDLALGARTSDI